MRTLILNRKDPQSPWQGIVEVVRNHELSFGRAQFKARPSRFYGNKFRHRLASLGNDHFFPQANSLQQAGEVRLSLVDIDFYT
jgi:hypothetical protein